MSDITRYRGDTRRIQRTVKENGVAIPITDWTFLLTISAEADPVDETEQVAQIAGVITDADNGVVEFAPEYNDVNWAGGNFYDIEAIDSDGGVSTLDKGQFILLQDITKPVDWIWTPDGIVGEEVVVDGSEIFWATKFDAADTWTYQDRGGVPVIRAALDLNSTRRRYLHAVGPMVPRGGMWPLGVELSYLIYLDDGILGLNFDAPLKGMDFWVDASLNLNSGSAASSSSNYSKDANQLTLDVPGLTWDTTGWVAGWYYLKVRMPSDELTNVTVSIHPQAGPENWKDWGEAVLAQFAPMRLAVNCEPTVGNAAAIAEIGEIRVVAL